MCTFAKLIYIYVNVDVVEWPRYMCTLAACKCHIYPVHLVEYLHTALKPSWNLAGVEPTDLAARAWGVF